MNKFKSKNSSVYFLTERNIHLIRLASLLLLLFAFQTIHAQQARITLNLKQVTVKEALKNIESKCNYTFLYKDAEIDVNRKVTINAKNEELSTILSRMLPNVSWTVKDKRIILMPKKGNATGKEKKVSGIVTDDKGEALIGVNVSIPGTSIGMITDIDGKYSITASEGNPSNFHTSATAPRPSTWVSAR